MTVIPFLVISFAAAAGALLVRRRPGLSLAVGIGGLLAATLTALAMTPGSIVVLGTAGQLETTQFNRFFLTMGCATGLVAVVLGLATAWQRNLPAAILGAFGALGLGLSIGDPIVAIIAILAGALVGSLVTIVAPVSTQDVRIASREFRAIAVAGVLALLGMAWIARPLGDLALEPTVFGFAYLLVAVAASIRFGAIPFHLWAARLADSSTEVALPLLLAWTPAGFAVVALAWMDRSIAPLIVPLEVERGVVVAIGASSIVLGAVAAWLQDDLEHVVAYSIVQDAGFVILGLAILEPAAWQPTRTWLLIFVVVKTAFAAWAVAVRTRFGTRRIPELDGWLRRSPLLGAGLLLIALATIGLPGILAWDTRGRLVELSVTSTPLRLLVTLGGLAAVTYYGRLALAGLRPAASRVRDAAGDRLVRPPVAAVDEGVVEQRSSVRRGRMAADAWRLNRAPIAASAVLMLAVTAAVVAVGGLGVRQAAAVGVPEPMATTAAPVESSSPPSFEPIPTGQPAP